MRRYTLLFAPLLTLCSFASGQSLDDQDIALGFRTHSYIASNIPMMPPGEVVSVVSTVWRNMVNAPSYAGSTIQPSLFVLDSPNINATATAGGRLYVFRGLVEAVHGNAGIIAFVIGHEMAHNRMRHGINRYFRAVQADYNIRQAYAQNTWAGIAAQTAQHIVEAKLERDEEHEADRFGLLLAAEAGYHPDFAILASRELRMTTSESSKFAAFFQGHPRWTTREQRAEGIRAMAIQAFNSRWPDVTSSPGGAPPTMVAVEDFQIAKDRKQKGVLRVSFSTDTRNVTSLPVQIVVTITREIPCEPVVIEQKFFVTSEEQQWNLTLDKPPKDKYGKRFIQVVAFMDKKVLFESERKKLD